MTEQWARPFRVFYPTGGTETDVVHGVQFPSGRCVLDHESRGLYYAAVSFDALDLGDDAEVEWADAAVSSVPGQEAGA